MRKIDYVPRYARQVYSSLGGISPKTRKYCKDSVSVLVFELLEGAPLDVGAKIASLLTTKLKTPVISQRCCSVDGHSEIQVRVELLVNNYHILRDYFKTKVAELRIQTPRLLTQKDCNHK